MSKIVALIAKELGVDQIFIFGLHSVGNCDIFLGECTTINFLTSSITNLKTIFAFKVVQIIGHPVCKQCEYIHILIRGNILLIN